LTGDRARPAVETRGISKTFGGVAALDTDLLQNHTDLLHDRLEDLLFALGGLTLQLLGSLLEPGFHGLQLLFPCPPCIRVHGHLLLLVLAQPLLEIRTQLLKLRPVARQGGLQAQARILRRPGAAGGRRPFRLRRGSQGRFSLPWLCFP